MYRIRYMVIQHREYNQYFLITINGVWRRQWHPTPVLLPGKSHGLRSLVGYSLWGRKESDTTERLHFTSFQYFFLKVTMRKNTQVNTLKPVTKILIRSIHLL